MKPTAPSLSRVWPYVLLGLIVLFSVAGNLYWLQQNVVQLGHDASAHLTRTLKMADAMSPLSWGSLLRGLTITEYRPPGLYLLVQPFYALFGRSIDTAQLANVVAQALIVVCTFFLARRVLTARAAVPSAPEPGAAPAVPPAVPPAAAPGVRAGYPALAPATANWLALLAAAMAALLPMLLAMSRLFYTEAPVTLAVVAAVFLLLQSVGYTRRAACVALGLALGAGLLTKWTLPLYLGVPMLLVAWQSPLRTSLQARDWRGLLRQPAPGAEPAGWNRRGLLTRVALAIAGAAAFALLLYWPQRELWAQTLLGPWLGVAWFGIFLALLGLALAPSTPLLNLLLALAVGGALASLWYLPRAGFAVELSDVAFGTGGGDFAAADWTSFNQYFRYFRLFFQHHLGLLLGLLILPWGLLPWLWHGRVWLRTLPETLLVVVATLSPFVLLIATSQTNSRNLAPVLPLFAIVVSIGLLAYRAPWRVGLAAAWLGALLLFWAVATVDGLAGFRAQTSLLWPRQGYSVAPASAETDPQYWIVPDVLAEITAEVTTAAAAEAERAAPARNAENPPENPPGNAPENELPREAEGSSGRPAGVDARTVQTATLGVMVETASLHSGSFEYDILLRNQPVDLNSLSGPEVRRPGSIITNQWLLITDGDNRELADAPRALAEQMRGGAAWFDHLYTRVKQYTFSDGDTVSLFRRSAGPADPYLFSTIVGTDLPPIAGAVRQWWSPAATLAVATPETAVWLGTQDVPLGTAVIPPDGRDLLPDDLGDVGRTLIVVSRYHTPQFQQWLGQKFRYVTEISSGEFTATLYGQADRPLDAVPPAALAGAVWPPLRMGSQATWTTLHPGDPLPVDVTLAAQHAGALDGSWKLSARLVDPAGTVVSQQDTAAVGGTLPLTLFVPPGAPPGAYSLQFVVYNAATQEAVVDAAGQPATKTATIEVLE